VRVVASILLFSALVSAQGRQGGAPPTARAAAPIDLTGTWVSVVTEDWRWRMRTPPKGDYASVPLNDAGTKAADTWDPAKDTAAGEQCRGYGAAAIMRMPGRIRISWDNDTTLKIETEAGTQTRMLNFVAPAQRGEPSWQGTSIANWQFAGGGRRGGGTAARRLTADHHDQYAPGVFAKERRPLQRKRSTHRVHQPHHRGER
jgi:hypothetical protein